MIENMHIVSISAVNGDDNMYLNEIRKEHNLNIAVRFCSRVVSDVCDH